MDDTTSQEPILVLGGTGKIGRRVAERLTARGLPVRIGSRSSEPRFDSEDRSTWFAQNTSEDHWREHVQGSAVALPAAEVPEPFVDAEDIADVAVAALTDDRHIGELYELTGPRLLTFADAVSEISRAVGREIRYEPISIEDFAAAAADQGVPGEVVEMLTFIFGAVLDGRNAHLADGVQRALGRQPRDFSDYARDAAATGIWDPTTRAV